MSCYTLPDNQDSFPTSTPKRWVVLQRDAGLMHIYTTLDHKIERWNTLLLEDTEAREVAKRIQQQFPNDQPRCTAPMISLMISGVVNLILLALLLWK